MLRPIEENRLENELPTTGLSVEYEGPNDAAPQTYEYDLDPFWATGDVEGDDASSTTEHPAIVFDYNTENEPVDARQPANNLKSIDNPANEPGFSETETAEVYDELTITVAVRREHDANGVPPQVRSKELTRRLWNYCRHALDVNEPGVNGERPMKVDVVSPPSPEVVERTLRRMFAIQLHHSETRTVEYDTVDDAEYGADLE